MAMSRSLVSVGLSLFALLATALPAGSALGHVPSQISVHLQGVANCNLCSFDVHTWTFDYDGANGGCTSEVHLDDNGVDVPSDPVCVYVTETAITITGNGAHLGGAGDGEDAGAFEVSGEIWGQLSVGGGLVTDDA